MPGRNRTGRRHDRAGCTRTMLPLVAAVLVGCGQDAVEPDPDPSPPPTADASKTTADVPAGRAGESTTITITVRDTDGDPISGAASDLAVSIADGPNQDAVVASITDGEDGTYATAYTPLAAGRDTLAISLSGDPIAGGPYTSRVDAGSAASLDLLSGDGQLYGAGNELPVPLVVDVLDEHGNPVAGASVAFEAVDGDGSLTDDSVSTDADGRAVTRWTLGSGSGRQSVEARHGSLEAVSFTAEALDFEMTIADPAPDLRFLVDESVALAAALTGDPVPDDSIRWISDIDGEIGRGRDVEVDAGGLSSGTHEVELSALGSTRGVPVRVFTDLWDLYRSEPAAEEVDRIVDDFELVFLDGDEPGQQWDAYGYDFNPGTGDPSRLVIVAMLDVLRRQAFDETPPFIGDHESVYDWLRDTAGTIRLDLARCSGAQGGGGTITVGRNLAYWGIVYSNTCEESVDPQFGLYSGPLGLLVHEARHSEPDDPGHTTCQDTGFAGDAVLEDGSGYAWAALYHMWVYAYARHDAAVVRSEDSQFGVPARRLAADLLEQRICGQPTHSDPRVQAIIDELLGG